MKHTKHFLTCLSEGEELEAGAGKMQGLGGVRWKVEGLPSATVLAWATHLHVQQALPERETCCAAGNVIALHFASCLNKTRRPNY